MPLTCLFLVSHLSGWHWAHMPCCPLNTQHTCLDSLLASDGPVLAGHCGWLCVRVPYKDHQCGVADGACKSDRCDPGQRVSE